MVSAKQLQYSISRVLAAVDVITEKSVLNDLVEKGQISLYQSNQIQAGRFKGFFFAQYKVLKLTRFRQKEYVVEALDMASGR